MISVVTVVRNGAGTLERTMASVLSQGDGIEYVIIDGGSDDGSVEMLQAHSDRIDWWQSEPDSGIAQAFNKGVAVAHGKWIGLINADDWYEPGALAAIEGELAASDADVVYGRVRYWRDDDPEFIAGGDHRRLDSHMSIPHPASFVRRDLYERVGAFDESLRYAMDYEFMLRARSAGARFAAVDGVLANMAQGGLGDRHWLDSMAETARVRARHVAAAGGAWRWRAYFVLRSMRVLARRGADRLGLLRPWRKRKGSGA